MKRNPSIELLRCVLMWMVVLYHSYRHGVFYRPDDCWSRFFLIIINWHVDCFVAISGWFGIRHVIQKFRNVYGQILFYSIIGMVWLAVIGRTKIYVSGGWFGDCYLALLLVVPFLNAAYDALVASGRRMLLTVWGGLALVEFLTWIPQHLFSSVNAWGAGSHTFLTLVFVYITVRVFSRFDVIEIKRYVWIPVVAFVFYSIVMAAILPMLPARMSLEWAQGYNSPFIISMAISILMCVVVWGHVPACLGRVASFVAPSMFGVLLFHDATPFGHSMIVLIENWLNNRLQNCGSFGIIFITANVVFVVSLCADMVRRFLVYFFSKLYHIFNGDLS